MLLQEQAEGDDEIDDEAELNLEKVEEEMAADYSEEVFLWTKSLKSKYRYLHIPLPFLLNWFDIFLKKLLNVPLDGV